MISPTPKPSDAIRAIQKKWNVGLDRATIMWLDEREASLRCLGCGRPFASPDHDPRCSSCVESGTGPEPAPRATKDPLAHRRRSRCVPS